MNFDRDNKRQVATTAFMLVVGGVMGYVVATMVLGAWHRNWSVGPGFLLFNLSQLRFSHPHEFAVAMTIMGLATGIGGLFGTKMVDARLTTFGVTRWQKPSELKKNAFFANPATGFMLGKTTKPEGKGQHIVSAKFPHCLLVAPTGRGKTVGFVIPNLLTFLGSAVVLDVKGECFEKTARHRE
ncbi:hypothetical protein FIC94_22225 [Ochrobactrum teleogrylli]|uniref:Type IV secretory system conjugative DNA transfer family protein n=1 Tax=Ochrobactrum teleogrylli TaxID=2479765 RepID=A0ABY2XY59_9HYPH|nr:hypothetical protein FIC94_22225 [[Ochrobactrum] teleogrylli]